MTDAQNEALDRMSRIMHEHFSAGIVVVASEDDDKIEELQAVAHGGVSRAIGLAELGKRIVMTSGRVK